MNFKQGSFTYVYSVSKGINLNFNVYFSFYLTGILKFVRSYNFIWVPILFCFLSFTEIKFYCIIILIMFCFFKVIFFLISCLLLFLFLPMCSILHLLTVIPIMTLFIPCFFLFSSEMFTAKELTHIKAACLRFC